MMALISTIRFIINHPLNRDHKTKAIFRFCKWQLNNMLNPYPIIYPFTEKSKLIIQKGMHGATGNLYCGLRDYEDMSFVLHFLRENDLFVDIGANVGSYSILATAHVGAETISIEPVPSTFTHLIDNININKIQEKVTALNVALGSEEGTINFTKNHDATNHVATSSDKDIITVPVCSLDKIITGKHIPILLKIDVEGFETEVLNGASKTLINDELKAIIIELNGSGKRYGYDESLIHQKLVDFGFTPFRYNPAKRELIEIDTFGSHNNTIYMRDIEYINERLRNAETIKLSDNIIYLNKEEI